MKKSFAAILATLATLLALAIPASAQDDARIHLIHGIPGADVDVLVDGAVVFEGFSFKDTQDLSSFAGQTLVGVQVNAAGTSDTLIDAGDVAVPASGNFTIIAHLDADGNPSIAVFENDTSTIDAGNGRLVVRHAAAAPAVDVKANGEVAFSNLANGAEAAADLPAGTISAEVVPTGADEPVVIGPADLPVGEGSSLIVYATGSLDDGLEVITETIDNLGPVPTAVHTGDSPITEGSSLLTTLLVAAAALVAVPFFAAGRRSLRTAGSTTTAKRG
ncbi:MAG: DUF4397 domain-containing protein [Acidimicrobiia bacterium]|nr:DUF4397 domain-containing protein [Acidimicrobiia bacterium]